jgi:simple sugar transport system substrate-binding protein
MYKNLAAMRLWACLLSACFNLTANGQTPITVPTSPPLKIGFVYVAPLTDAGWVRQHDLGRKAVEAALNNGAGAKVTTTYVENVAEGPDP